MFIDIIEAYFYTKMAAGLVQVLLQYIRHIGIFCWIEMKGLNNTAFFVKINPWICHSYRVEAIGINRCGDRDKDRDIYEDHEWLIFC